MVAATLLPSSAWADAGGKKLALSLDQVPALKEVRGAALVKLHGYEVLLVRDTETSVRAIEAICTHKRCTVKFRPEDVRFACPCHDSAFTLDGKVLSGPATEPLKVLRSRLQLDKDRVLLQLPAEPPADPPEE